MSNRDDFAKQTIETLGRRVGYLCSNPTCKKHTSGPNSNDNKSTLIGVAAHITAAAPGGPRYDNSISSDERRSINNGIWLCSNCASLIDKDEAFFPTELLKLWKFQLEFEMSKALAGQNIAGNVRTERPILEADLLFNSSNRGPYNYGWKLGWRFTLVIMNNSSFPAYNVKIVVDNKSTIQVANYLLSANSLVPHGSLQLEAHSQLIIEGDYMDADALMENRIPKHLNGPLLKILYKDEARNEHTTLVSINGNEVVNELSK